MMGPEKYFQVHRSSQVGLSDTKKDAENGQAMYLQKMRLPNYEIPDKRRCAARAAAAMADRRNLRR
jgi:hypothetical protein